MMHHGTARIRVEAIPWTAPGYEVIVRSGALRELAERVTLAAPAESYVVITPHRLEESYGARAVGALRAGGLRAELLAFADDEAGKTRDTWAALTDRMLALELGRGSCVIALGGGVTGDVAGFVAATYMRGVPFVQVPTTLLAMIDASVGGKTGVDTAAGKNLVGAFHSPRLVVIDPDVLHTLPPMQLRAGLAEAVKHGAILDAEYFAWIERSAEELLALDSAALEHLIVRSVQLKAGVVSADPLEAGRRVILNFGHTVGHALEHASGYAVAHGFAVAAGMWAEAKLGEAAGVTVPGSADALARVLSQLGLPTTMKADRAVLMQSMRIDKKASRAQPRFVLLRAIGECASDLEGGWTHAVDAHVLVDVLHDPAMTPDGV